MTLLLLLVSFPLCVCCGSEPTSQDLAYRELVTAYFSEVDDDPSQALTEANTSLDYEVTGDALAFRSEIEYILDDQESAFATLSTFDELYPDDGLDNLIKACFYSSDSGDCDEILSNMETALNENYGDETCDSFWEMLESDGGFSYFRESCATEYAGIEDEKTECPEEPLGACKDNKTKFVSKPLGPKLWIKNDDVQHLHEKQLIISLVMRALPIPMPVKVVLSTAIAARAAEIKGRNRGCGVVLNWTWINFPSITFWVTVQK